MTDDCYSYLQDHDSKHIYDLNINLFAALFTDEYSNTFYSQASWGELQLKKIKRVKFTMLALTSTSCQYCTHSAHAIGKDDTSLVSC